MFHPPDILSIACKQPQIQDQMELMMEKDQQMPGSVQYTVRRYRRQSPRIFEDTGMMIYHFQKEESSQNFLELRFCITGNSYCKAGQGECDDCSMNAKRNCTQRVQSTDVFTFRFSAVHLSQFIKPKSLDNSASNSILEFTHASSFYRVLPICGRTRLVLEALLNHNYADALENIYVNAQTQMLLLYSLECMLGEKDEDTFQCKFLANEADREKIVHAREILIRHIGEPITIKELSRKAAINECYLKKGFKELFGTTIFDFYQSQRMEHARYLLYEKGLSVTDVSMILGYSSISHFSTAFKKHTGLKPCELLLR